MAKYEIDDIGHRVVELEKKVNVLWEKNDALQNVIDWVKEDHASIQAFSQQLDAFAKTQNDFQSRLDDIGKQLKQVTKTLEFIQGGIEKLLERK